jgi:hypothetical protein
LSILTKISVVILVVASIVASVVFTALATVQPNWKHSFELEKQAYDRLDGRCQEYMAEAVQVRKQLTDASKDHQTKYATAVQKQHAIEQEVRQRVNEITKMLGQRDLVVAKLTELQQTSERQAETLVQYKSDLEAARKTLTTTAKDIILITDELAHVKSINEQLQLNLKTAREENAEKQAQLVQKDELISQLRQSGGKIGKDTGDVVTGDAITGTIKAVDNQLVAVNVGSANGIKKGMKLIVYRGGTFVGHIRIQQVTLAESVGLVIDKKMNPQPGDKATTRLD